MFQKFLSLYLKGCRLAARAFDALSSLGVTTSQQWVFMGIDRIVQSEQEKYSPDILRRRFLVTHDNVNIAFRVYEPTVNRQSHFDSGTAVTLFMPPPQTEGLVLNAAAFREKRRSGRKRPINEATILAVNSGANLRRNRGIRPTYKQQQIMNIDRAPSQKSHASVTSHIVLP